VVGGPRVLVVGAGGRAESRSVELGPVLGERALIARGLRVGERVIVQGMAAAGDLVVVSEGERPR